MRKIIFSLVLLHVVNVFAAPVEPLNEVTKGIATYLPYVKMLVYVLAILVGVGGGIIITFIKMQDENAKVKPRIVITAAACIMLIASATALPQFFGYEADGSTGDLLASLFDSESGNTSDLDSYKRPHSGSDNKCDYDRVDGDYIKTEIPDLEDHRWKDDPRYMEITVNKETTTVASFLSEIWEFCGGGSDGSYGRTMNFILNMYRHGAFDLNTYNILMSKASESLPRC